LSETNQNIAKLNSTKRQLTCGSDGAMAAVDRLLVRREGDSGRELASVSGVRNDGKSVTIANDNVKPAGVNRQGFADFDMLTPIRWSRHFRLLSSATHFSRPAESMTILTTTFDPPTKYTPPKKEHRYAT
jgi:hypothetical protein